MELVKYLNELKNNNLHYELEVEDFITQVQIMLTVEFDYHLFIQQDGKCSLYFEGIQIHNTSFDNAILQIKNEIGY